MSNKLKTKLALLYVLFLITGFFYVKHVINRKDVTVSKKEQEEVAFEVKPANVKLILNNSGKTTEYQASMLNIDSVSKFLEKARKDKFFYYEVDEYKNDVDILLDGKFTEEDTVWRLFLQGEDITKDFRHRNLEDGAVYTLQKVEI